MPDWYVEHVGEPEGPYSPAQMRRLVAEGRITAQTRVRRETENWYVAERIPGLLDPPGVRADPAGDSTGGWIPYNNPAALTAYYLAVASLIPCAGSLLGAAAFVLGIIGLHAHREQPPIKGATHAWVGIILGGVMALIWTVVIIVTIVNAAAGM